MAPLRLEVFDTSGYFFFHQHAVLIFFELYSIFPSAELRLETPPIRFLGDLCKWQHYRIFRPPIMLIRQRQRLRHRALEPTCFCLKRMRTSLNFAGSGMTVWTYVDHVPPQCRHRAGFRPIGSDVVREWNFIPTPEVIKACILVAGQI